MRQMTPQKILYASIGISAVLMVIGIVTADAGIIGNAVILSTFIISAPILYFRYKKFREIKEMEEKFPNFLRDLTESLRAGLPLHKAIVNANKINYGSLSKEVAKMTNQITWGIPVDKVLRQFSERVKSSRRLTSGTQVILESYLTGGEVISTMNSVAESNLTLIETEKEKESALGQYVIVMYAISIIFIIIVVAVSRLLVPIFTFSQAGADFGLSNPCDSCNGVECGVCAVYGGVSGGIFGLDRTSIASYYTALFFFMSMVQAIFSGLVAGEISEGSVIAGARHSLILASITFGVFSIFVRLGLFG